MEGAPTEGRIPEHDGLIVVIGDIEMGPGGAVDDFPHSEWLGRLLTSYLDEGPADKRIDFVFNGDVFDLLKTPFMGEHTRHITAHAAMGKMIAVAAQHPRFFEAVRAIASHPSGNKYGHFVTGNHDAEFAFPEVQQLVRAMAGGSDRVQFPGFSFSRGPVYVEHGNQYDPMFRFETEKPFVEYRGEKILNISWATVALLEVIIPLQPLLYHHDRLNPKNRVFGLVPELKELIMGLFWDYWTQDFFSRFVYSDDPMRKVSWTMLKEIVRRFTVSDTELEMEDDFLKKIAADPHHEVFVTGHLHRTARRDVGDKKLIQCGCFRDEFRLIDDAGNQEPELKSYVEIYLDGDEVSGINLRELMGPPRPPGTFPVSIFDVLPKVKNLLLPKEERDRLEAARLKQESEEEKGK